jgi:hypothetical protein
MLYSAMAAKENRTKTKKAAEGNLDFFDMLKVVFKIIYYFSDLLSSYHRQSGALVFKDFHLARKVYGRFGIPGKEKQLSFAMKPERVAPAIFMTVWHLFHLIV